MSVFRKMRPDDRPVDSRSLALSLALLLAACSQGHNETLASSTNDSVPVEDAGLPLRVRQEQSKTEARVASDVASPSPSAAAMITLEGLGDLRIGKAVPKNGSWAERGAQTKDACRTVSSPEFPGVYAIVTDGAVRRITVGRRSNVKLLEGIGTGATEHVARKSFAGFREEAHKYEKAPAKYLSAPNASSGSPALRFEIGGDGRVTMMHVGTAPVLNYVEGCA
jgi:hypothetical protein